MEQRSRVWLLACGLLSALACGDTEPPGPPPSTDCRPAVGGPAGGVHVLRFESTTPAVRVHLRRRYLRAGAGESVIYGLDAVTLERDGSCVTVTDAARLTYTNSHHNWQDQAAARSDVVEYRLAMQWDVPNPLWRITLTGVEPGSDRVLFPAITLTTTGGPIGLHAMPSRLPVQVTELQAENTGGWKDEAAEAEPWIELWNPSAEAVDLGGYGLSNDPADRRRWTFPAGTMIGRHQVLVIAADGQPEQGPLHGSFRLAPGAGSVVLTDAGGVTAGERSYPAVPAGRSVQFSAQTDSFVPSTASSPGTVAF